MKRALRNDDFPMDIEATVVLRLADHAQCPFRFEGMDAFVAAIDAGAGEGFK